MFKNKVSMPVVANSGGGLEIKSKSVSVTVNAKSYNVGDYVYGKVRASTYGASEIYIMNIGLLGGSLDFNINGDCKFIPVYYNEKSFNEYSVIALVCIKNGTVSSNSTIEIDANFILK